MSKTGLRWPTIELKDHDVVRSANNAGHAQRFAPVWRCLPIIQEHVAFLHVVNALLLHMPISLVFEESALIGQAAGSDAFTRSE